jgi:hypothetical protein
VDKDCSICHISFHKMLAEVTVSQTHMNMKNLCLFNPSLLRWGFSRPIIGILIPGHAMACGWEFASCVPSHYHHWCTSTLEPVGFIQLLNRVMEFLWLEFLISSHSTGIGVSSTDCKVNSI